MEGPRGLGGDVGPGGAARELAVGEHGVGGVHAVQQPVAGGLVCHGTWGGVVKAGAHAPAGVISVGPMHVLAAGGAAPGHPMVPTPPGVVVVGAAVIRAVVLSLSLVIPVQSHTEP